MLALFISYGESRKTVFRLLQENILSIVTTTSVLLDGDTIESFKSIESMKTPAYKEIYENLKQIRDINRRFDLYLEYIYLVTKSPQDPDKFILIMDPDEHVNGTLYGYPFEDVDGLEENLDKAFVPSHFSTDQWGTYLSGYSPIYDSSGKWVATVGIDVNSELIHSYLHVLLKNAVIALIISLIIAIIFARMLAKLVTTSLNHVCNTVDRIGHGDFSSRIELGAKDEFFKLSVAINLMAKGLQERERLKLGFARYVSQYILDRILQSEVSTKLEGERKKVTILFSDIRQFTSLAEKMPPEHVVSILNAYFEKMIEAIFKFNGTLDKFIGDGMMVEFGAPLEDELQEKHAIKAAIAMQIELDKLNERWRSEGNPELQMGIGIHTGLAIVGNIGSEKRMEYTAVGDAVNIAARLEQATKTIKRGIIVSQSVYDATKDIFRFDPLGKAKLPGKVEEVEVYSLILDEKAIKEISSSDNQDGSCIC